MRTRDLKPELDLTIILDRKNVTRKLAWYQN